MADEKRFLNATEVSEIMECSKSHAYQIIRQLNSEFGSKRVHRSTWQGECQVFQ